MKNIVVALGGNALGNNPQEQLELVKTTSKQLVDLIENGHNLIITHGNGPQVGMITKAFEVSSNTSDVPSMPFAECGAMSQGYIGYHLQQAILEELKNRNINKNVATIITQVVVDKDDKAFDNPTKPIGKFYTKEEALKEENDKGYKFVEDSGRGYRRVVASPMPIEIVELKIIKDLINSGNIVIVSGGGGIPVIRENNSLKGVDAVIDKDRSSSLLADKLDADTLLILTAVNKVCVNFNNENEQQLDKISIDEAKKYINNKEFGEGSMLPKVESCISFCEKKESREGIITSLYNAKDAVNHLDGTIIIK